MHILIVEDEKEMADLLRKGLEEENHTVNLAFDGRDALEMAQALVSLSKSSSCSDTSACKRLSATWVASSDSEKR
jgi:DNA-binding response OmpR family regulator